MHNIHNIFLSVILPAYNAQTSLSKAVCSIENVTTEHSIQIIIVDDGSTDGTVSICEALAEKYHNIVWVSQNNSGPSAARLHGLSYVKGEYVTFLDADDYWDSEAYSCLIEHIFYNRIDIVEFGYREVFLDGHTNLEYPLENIIKKEKEIIKRTATYNRNETSYVVWNKIYKYSLFKDVVFPNFFCGEDLCVVTQVMSKAKTYECIQGIFYNYMINDASLTRTKSIKKKIDCIACGEFILDFYSKHHAELIPYALRYLIRTTMLLHIEIVRNNISYDKKFIPYIKNKYHKYLWQLISTNKGMRCLNLKDYVLIIIYILFGANGSVFVSKLKHIIK